MNVHQGRPACAATSPGVRKIPEPTIMPTTIARPSTRRSDFLSSVMRAENLHRKTEGRSLLRPSATKPVLEPTACAVLLHRHHRHPHPHQSAPLPHHPHSTEPPGGPRHHPPSTRAARAPHSPPPPVPPTVRPRYAPPP